MGREVIPRPQSKYANSFALQVKWPQDMDVSSFRMRKWNCSLASSSLEDANTKPGSQ